MSSVARVAAEVLGCSGVHLPISHIAVSAAPVTSWMTKGVDHVATVQTRWSS
jgi:hypothetical protein